MKNEKEIYPILKDEDVDSYDSIRENLGVVLYARDTVKELEDEDEVIFVKDSVPGGIYMVAEVLMRESENVYYHIPLTTDLVVKEKLDIEEVFKEALLNMSKKIPMIFEKTTDRIKISPIFENPNFYVVHTDETFGASALFYPGVMEEIGDRLDNNYFIMPLTRDFVIVAADDGTKDADRLESYLVDQNKDLDMDAETFLSNTILYYNRATGLTTANEMKNKGKVIYINGLGDGNRLN